MNQHQNAPGNVFLWAVVVEGALAAAAFGLGWILGQPPLATIAQAGLRADHAAWAVAWGLAGALPLFLMLALLERLPLAPLVDLRDFVRRHVVPLFAGMPVWQMAVISLLAGLGEELLFRGALQAGAARLVGGTPGIVVGLALSALLFGAAHALTQTYAVLATLVGLHLGCLFLASGNLLGPIVAHALYDFVALVYLVKWPDLKEPRTQ